MKLDQNQGKQVKPRRLKKPFLHILTDTLILSNVCFQKEELIYLISSVSSPCWAVSAVNKTILKTQGFFLGIHLLLFFIVTIIVNLKENT